MRERSARSPLPELGARLPSGLFPPAHRVRSREAAGAALLGQRTGGAGDGRWDPRASLRRPGALLALRPRDSHASAGCGHVGGQRLPWRGEEEEEEEEGVDAAPGAVLTAPGGSGAARGCGGAAPWHAGHLRRSGGRRLGGGGAGAGGGGGSAQRPRSRAASGQWAGAPLPASSAAKPAVHKRGSGASRRGAETKRGQGRRAGSCGRRKGLESRADSEARGLAGHGVCGKRGRCGSGGTGREEREREKHKVSITEGAGGGPVHPAEPHSAKMRVGAVAAVKPHTAALATSLAPTYTLSF